MAISKYVSKTTHIGHKQQIVFDYLSNFENLGAYINSELLEKIASKVPQVTISDFESDKDSCRFRVTGIGQAELRIVDREPVKSIKVRSEGGLPVDLTFWIQLMPVSESQTKMRLTLHAEMSMMIKMMMGDRLEEGLNQLADTIAALPYK
jgi:carbon monoxide dehydrogenase subunit G